MEGVLTIIDRFRTQITVVLVAAILTGGGVLLTRSFQLTALYDREAKVANDDAGLKELQERQQALLAELEQLRSATTAAPPASDTSATNAPTSTASTSVPGDASRIVHLNTADQTALETLPGIGESKAKAILDYRTTHGHFGSIDELDSVKGIGPATVARLKPHLTLD